MVLSGCGCKVTDFSSLEKISLTDFFSCEIRTNLAFEFLVSFDTKIQERAPFFNDNRQSEK